MPPPSTDSPEPTLPHLRSAPVKRPSKRSLETSSAAVEASAGSQHATGHTAAMTRYFNAVRVLYTHGKPRGSGGAWTALEPPFGCASVVESADVLRYLLSPLRPSHVLDTWTPYEISCFEVGITQLGKQFHAIQRYLIPTKSTRDVVLFYYMWKKHGLDKAEWADKDAAHDHFGLKRMKHERNLHGILPTAFDLMSDEDDSTTLAVKQSSLLTQQPRPKRAAAGAGLSTNPSATHPNLVKLAALRTDGTKLFSTLRALYDSSTDDHHTSPTGELRLPRGIVATAPLRSAARPPHLLDSWTAWELSVFENGLDVYGKHFDYVAALLPRKATSDVIALYYLWKKFSPTVYRRMKAAWPASPFGKVIDPPLSSSSPPPLLSDDEATAPLSTFHNATPHT